MNLLMSSLFFQVLLIASNSNELKGLRFGETRSDLRSCRSSTTKFHRHQPGVKDSEDGIHSSLSQTDMGRHREVFVLNCKHLCFSFLFGKFLSGPHSPE